MSEVFNLQMGKTPSRENPLYWNGRETWVSIGDLGFSKYISTSKECITKRAVAETGIKISPKGSVLMSFKLSVGKTAIAATDLYSNEAIMSFNPKEGFLLSPEYVYYYLKEYKWDGLNRAVMGFTLNKNTISQGVFSYPPLEEQERIVAELDLLTGVIEKQKAQLKELDNLAQSIFYDMFGDIESNDNGFRCCKLIEVVDSTCSLSYGIVQPGDDVEDGIPVVRPIDLKSTYVGLHGLKKTSVNISNSYKRTILQGNEILLCVRGTTGDLSITRPELKGCNTTRGIVPIRLCDMVETLYAYYLFKSNSLQKIIREKTYGATLKQINIKDVKDLPVVLPPLQLQQQFAEKIEAIEHQKTLIKKSIEETQKLFDYTMDKYFG